MSLAEIHAMRPNEVRELTKEQLIEHILEGQTYTANEYRHEDEYHNATEQGWEIRDSYTGNLISKHRVVWTYHDAKKGTVNEIITEDGKERTIVKHTLDGKQPSLIRRAIEEPIPIKEI